MFWIEQQLLSHDKLTRHHWDKVIDCDLVLVHASFRVNEIGTVSEPAKHKLGQTLKVNITDKSFSPFFSMKHIFPVLNCFHLYQGQLRRGCVYIFHSGKFSFLHGVSCLYFSLCFLLTSVPLFNSFIPCFLFLSQLLQN